MTNGAPGSHRDGVWDGVLAFHHSWASLATLGVAFVVLILGGTKALTVPAAGVCVALALSYWAALGVRSVRNVRSGRGEPT